MITTQLTHKENRKDSYEYTTQISLTVPNQSLTIREILTRSGVIDSGLPMYYDENPTHDGILPTDTRDFDLSDVQTISEEIVERRAMRKAESEAKRSEAEAKRKAEEQKAKDEAEAKARASEVEKK